ncbi:putative quorum-sensing-regulated virulence factor [Reinekea sp. G2M2-21]|uniref:putative quorum-sensing-regulated virulence factor n=1 Tax=Reinekea sp. G2M2-21 TaxID=2788942 RepID=UPI002104B53D|nr:DUF3820 family protein [Reinekea sp. G2M2-21]
MPLTPQHLIELAHTTMPYGQYAGRRLIHLPESYLIWLQDQKTADTHLAQLLSLALLIRSEGLEHLLDPITKPLAPGSPLLQ